MMQLTIILNSAPGDSTPSSGLCGNFTQQKLCGFISFTQVRFWNIQIMLPTKGPLDSLVRLPGKTLEIGMPCLAFFLSFQVSTNNVPFSESLPTMTSSTQIFDLTGIIYPSPFRAFVCSYNFIKLSMDAYITNPGLHTASLRQCQDKDSVLASFLLPGYEFILKSSPL